MLRITLKETVTKEIEVPMDTLYHLIDNLSPKERAKLLRRMKRSPLRMVPFKKDKIESIMADFKGTDIYEDQFLKDLEQGLKKSSLYK